MLHIRHVVAAVVLAAIAACATPPEPVPPFAERLATAEAAGTPYQVDAALTALLDGPKLATAQRAETLYRRGVLRRLSGDDRRGAVADLQTMLALAPDHPRAEQAAVELNLAKSDLEALESRLSLMLTLPQWFDVSWALGERDGPARRYQVAGLSPTEDQTRKLKDAGFICGEDGEGGPVQGVGDTRDWLDGLTWCDPLPEPEAADVDAAMAG